MVRLALALSVGTRQPNFGADVQPGRHAPEGNGTGGLPVGQLVHSEALGPSHSLHEALQTEQPVSPVAVHAAVSNWPDGHVEHELHVVLPVPLANVPPVQPMQLAVP